MAFNGILVDMTLELSVKDEKFIGIYIKLILNLTEIRASVIVVRINKIYWTFIGHSFVKETIWMLFALKRRKITT